MGKRNKSAGRLLLQKEKKKKYIERCAAVQIVRLLKKKKG
jgi:hypothetical protein